MWYDRIATPSFPQFPYLRERPIGRLPLPPPLIPKLLGPPMTRGTGVSRSFSLNKAMRCTTHHTVSWLFLTIDYEDASVNPITLGAKERRYWSVSYELCFYLRIYNERTERGDGTTGAPSCYVAPRLATRPRLATNLRNQLPPRLVTDHSISLYISKMTLLLHSQYYQALNYTNTILNQRCILFSWNRTSKCKDLRL